VSQRRIHVLYNRVRPEFLSQKWNKDASRQALGLPANSTIVTVIGRLVPRKGQDVFLRAIALLAQQSLDVHGVLAGDVPSDPVHARRYNAYKAELEQLACQPTLQGRITFLGHRDDVQSVLAASDIVVMPSFAEPFGLVILEALAAGAPIVASNAGGHPEVIENGVTGLLVPPGDAARFAAAIRRLIEDPDVRSGIATRGRQGVLVKFSEDSLAAQLESIYSALVDRPDNSDCMVEVAHAERTEV
jgi:glycosyltransferase involved in cell wall biosynthesis